MKSDNLFDICVLPGDGIGVEVTDVALQVVQAAVKKTGRMALNFITQDAGADLYLRTGNAMPDEAWRVAEEEIGRAHV